MEEVIRVEHLKKYFKDVKAVDDISFSVNQGELFGFLGVNGAGKSTTIQMLCTLSVPTDGQVTVNGLQLGRDDGEIKKHIGVVYQHNCLDDLLTVRENLMLWGKMYGIHRAKLRGNLEDVCGILELTEVIGRPYGKLSGGQKRRCEIARALMHAPHILFLDEPTTGLDPAARKSVWQTIHKLQKELRMTVFLTTHYMEEAAKADHIGIMERGHLIQYGTPFALKEQFASDKLRLIPREQSMGAILEHLKKRQIPYKVKEGRISITVDRTMDALPVVEAFREMLMGFEVIQGTMDDVFLKVTGGEKEYA